MISGFHLPIFLVGSYKNGCPKEIKRLNLPIEGVFFFRAMAGLIFLRNGRAVAATASLIVVGYDGYTTREILGMIRIHELGIYTNQIPPVSGPTGGFEHCSCENDGVDGF
jgi:hypothetical protein